MNPICNDEMIEAAANALRNDRFVKGNNVKEFEELFAKFIGAKYAIALNSGTSALHLALAAMGIKAGDYVVTTSATFIATANAVSYLHGRTIFADIDKKTYNIDPEKLAEQVKKHKGKVKAVIPVHLYGYPCQMDEISEICQANDLLLLEDACQAHGAKYKGKSVGSIGDAAAYSFYPSKNLTVCGDGGMVVTYDGALNEKIRSLRDCGRSSTEQYLHTEIGYSARLNTVNAAIGKVQLKYLPAANEKRRKNAALYNKLLNGVGDLTLPQLGGKDIEPVFHIYAVTTKSRDELKKYLTAVGIECGIHYPIPVHLQPPYKLLGYSEGMYPNTERWAKEVLSLPMFPDLTTEQIEYVATNVKKFFKEKA